MANPRISSLLSFGTFELDLQTSELRKKGVKIKLQDQPFQILVLLLEHPGNLVSREEIQKKLWPADTFVDFDLGLNTAISRLRASLGDSAENPRFIETLPRRGYRFIGPSPEPREAKALTSKPENGTSETEQRSAAPSTGQSARLRSLAVLPFADMSPERDQEHFCDGIAEELISSLARIRQLRVAARTSAFFFKGKNADIREIGQKLGVEAIVEGSVRKAGSALRITAQLINVADGYHLWTERYDREIKDVFAIQDEVTSAIIEHLMITLLPEERSGIFRRRTDNVEAHDLYLKGLHYLWTDLSRGFKDTIRAFEQAIEKDPEYAQAYWGLSAAYLQVAIWGKVPPSDACRKAKFYVRRALAIDPSLGEARALLSYLYVIHDWNWKAAEREFLEAIRLCPNSSIVHEYYCNFLLTAQRFDEAVAEALKAQSLDPASSFTTFAVGTAFGISGDFPRAIEEYQAGIRLNPDYYMLHTWLGWTLFANGQYSEGIVAHEKALELSQRLPYFVASLATAYHKLGRTAEADALWRELEERAQREYVPAICFVQKNSLRDEKFWPTLRSLKKAAEERDIRLCFARVLPAEYLRGPKDSLAKLRLKKAILKMIISRILARHRILETARGGKEK